MVTEGNGSSVPRAVVATCDSLYQGLARSGGEAAMLTCVHCQSECPNGSQFCLRCGRPIESGGETSDEHAHEAGSEADESASPRPSQRPFLGPIVILSPFAIAAVLLFFVGAAIVTSNTADTSSPGQAGVTTTDLVATWQESSPITGGLWVPQVTFNVRNDGESIATGFKFAARFSNGQGVIQGDDIYGSVDAIPAGLSRGPVLLQGAVGYKSDVVFLSMITSPASDWRYDLYYASGGQWVALTSGTVEVPAQYKSMFGGK
jgi:hypothetical protein